MRRVPPELRGLDGRWWTEGHRLYLHVRGSGAKRTPHPILAMQVDVSVAFVGQVLDRRERPGFDLAYRMLRVHGIPMEAWHEPAHTKAPLYRESSTDESPMPNVDSPDATNCAAQ
jgi:hypothetical protein